MTAFTRTFFRLLFTSVIVNFLFTYSANAQSVTAYTDYIGKFQVFDNGVYRQIEYLPVKSYKVGSESIAYIDNRNDFKVYWDGQVYNQVNAANFSYFMTEYLIAYKVGSVLYVFDNGEKKILCYYNSILAVNDSVLTWFDNSNYTLSIYYRGKEAELESSLLEAPKSIKTGSNIVAWVSQTGYFNIFYQGEMHTPSNYPPVNYEAGQDIVAYQDEYDRNFHLFYKGDTAMAEEFAPDSFKVGFGIMAYVDYLGNFRAFYNGSIEKLLSDRPSFFQVKGNVIVYAYNRMFNVYYLGKVYTLENYTPTNFQVSNNGVAWIDLSGRLMLFDKGKTYTVSYDVINDYSLTSNVLKYETGTNTVNVFFNGKSY